MPEPDTTKRPPFHDTRMPVPEASLYKPGGFCPTHLGDHLHNRYRIVHKLGHGDDGTVWLAAIDPPLSSGQSQLRYVTLKILRSVLSTNSTNENNQELEVFNYLSSQENEASDGRGRHPGEAKVIRLLHTFEVNSANGTHLVLVLPFRGFCLRDVKEFDPKWESDVKKRQSICKQIAWGVAYLHRRGICHGDLTATNVLIGMDIIQNCDPANLYQHLGNPEKIPFESALACEQADHVTMKGAPVLPYPTIGGAVGHPTNSSTPSYIVTPIDASKLKTILFGDKPNATIIDFGRSFRFGPVIMPMHRPSVPIFYPAPESLFDCQITEKVDIWFLACLIFQIRSGEILFQGPFFGGFKKGRDEELAVKCWEQALGHPTGFFKLNPKDVTFDKIKKYTIDDRGGPGSQAVRSIILKTGGGRIVGEEIHWLWELLAPMLRYNPKFRVGAEEVVTSYYFKKWVRH